MIRHCDGTDINLVMLISDETGKKVDTAASVFWESESAKAEPCDCGAKFEDETQSVFWPHRTFTKGGTYGPAYWGDNQGETP